MSQAKSNTWERIFHLFVERSMLYPSVKTMRRQFLNQLIYINMAACNRAASHRSQQDWQSTSKHSIDGIPSPNLRLLQIAITTDHPSIPCNLPVRWDIHNSIVVPHKLNWRKVLIVSLAQRHQLLSLSYVHAHKHEMYFYIFVLG